MAGVSSTSERQNSSTEPGHHWHGVQARTYLQICSQPQSDDVLPGLCPLQEALQIPHRLVRHQFRFSGRWIQDDAARGQSLQPFYDHPTARAVFQRYFPVLSGTDDQHIPPLGQSPTANRLHIDEGRHSDLPGASESIDGPCPVGGGEHEPFPPDCLGAVLARGVAQVEPRNTEPPSLAGKERRSSRERSGHGVRCLYRRDRKNSSASRRESDRDGRRGADDVDGNGGAPWNLIGMYLFTTGPQENAHTGLSGQFHWSYQGSHGTHEGREEGRRR